LKKIMVLLVALLAILGMGSMQPAAATHGTNPGAWPTGNYHPHGNCNNFVSPSGNLIILGGAAPKTGAEVAELGWNQGFRGARLRAIIAITWLESNMCPRAYNGRDQDDSYGLAQINTYGSLWPLVQAGCSPANKNDLYTPYVNMRCAKWKADTQGFSAWSTYDTSAYWAVMPWVNNVMTYKHYPLT
jgi:hypothetical protein